jgi:protein JSN1
MEPSRSLWIGNVTPLLDENALRETFGHFGNIETVRVLLPKNCAFITYQTVDEATAAKQMMDKQKLGDTQIRVNYGKN